MKRYLTILIILFVIPISCSDEDFRLDEKTDPQSLSLDEGDLGDYFLNIQVQFSKFFEEYHQFNRELARYTTMTGSRLYENAFLPTAFDVGWRIAYTNILVNTETIISLGTEKNQIHLVGASRVIKTLTFLTLVDMFGDIPFSEALKGSESSNPKLDSSESIYQALISELETAISELNDSSSVSLPNDKDLIYDGTAENWIKAANSLLIKIYVQQRKVVSGTSSKIDAIVNSGNYIQSKAEDFEFKYSTSTSPDSRHFLYASNYITGASDYLGNGFMNMLLNDKSIRDPRLRYYMIRQQTTNTTDVSEKDCLSSVKPNHYSESDPFCELIEGYWGRDHGDDAGIPPDTRARTTWGVYPAGGAFDADQGVAVTSSSGGKGAGISPILLSSYVDFYLAEAALTMNTSGDPQVLLQSAINKSFEKVTTFNTRFGVNIPDDFAANQSEFETYTNEVITNYGNTSSVDEKLSIMSKEFYLAAFGNGFEAYNLYRRTGYPKLQLSLAASPGSFIRTFKYPSDLVNRNINVSAKDDQTTKVFWDNEDNDFVK